MSNFQHPFNDSLKKISDRLDILLRKQSFKERQDPNYVILDNADILQLFKISSKTAANWREDGVLPYSHIKGKIYYKLIDMHKLIDDNYNPSKKK
tara:strand:- start:2214 stop:2498 length:285 start_codon:yes stop_codon:yes gene_type:complete